MVNIAQVATGGGKFVKTTEIRQYPFLAITIKRKQSGLPGYKGKGTTTHATIDLVAFDVNHKVVFEGKDLKWDCGDSVGAKLPGEGELPATVVIAIRKEVGRDGDKEYNNLYNIGEPDLSPIVAELNRREQAVLEAMQEAPSF